VSAKLPLLLDPDDAGIARAAACLRDGGLVSFPTETVYGLGADTTQDGAVARIFEAKGRPTFNPLIVHAPSADHLRPLVQWSGLADQLAAAFWPGPLTLVLPRAAGCPVSLLASAGLGTLAVRVPAHPVAKALLEAAGVPVAAPSANRSNAISPTEAAHVAASLGGRVEMILDGGPCGVGLESTVVDLSGAVPMLLREGGLPREELLPYLPDLQSPAPDAAIRSPGMLAKHYAPDCAVRLNVTQPLPGEALLAFGPDVPVALKTLNLSETGNLTESAANLFRHLHALNAVRPAGIAVMPVPETGIGRAINDRLRRAAAV
jgi:L-threonylcarbamoyladenylate synthase